MANKELVSKIEYYSFRALLAIMRFMPGGCVKSFLIVLFHLVGYGIGIRKKVALVQLEKVYPSLSIKQRKSILKKLFRNMALSIYEVYFTNDSELFAMSSIANKHYVDDALALGRGAVLATAHFGNWEAARILPMSGIPLSVVAKTQRNRMFDKYTNDVRQRCGVKVIDMSKGLRAIVHQLSEGRFVAILMDQNAGSSGLLMDFLGYCASHWKGVAKLSLRYKVPIVPGFARRADDDNIVFDFFPPILHEDWTDSEENLRKVLEEVNAIIEQQIHKYPEQWFWVHKRWKYGYDMFSK